MRGIVVALAIVGTSATAFAEPANPDLDKAKEQYADLFFEEALVSLQKALQIGVADKEQTAEIYLLTGMVTATLDQAGAAKSNFIKFLSIDPDGKLPEGQSPKITGPFKAAKKVVGGKGIEIAHAIKSTSPPRLLLVVKNDPANLVAGAHARYWEGGDNEKTTLAPGKGEINIQLGDKATGVVLSAVDEYGNVLATIGSRDDRIKLEGGSVVVEPDPDPGDGDKDDGKGFRYWWVVSAAVTVGFAAGGTVLGLSASNKVSEIEDAIDNSSDFEFSTDVKPLEDKAKDQALYANIAFGAAGVGAIVTAILFWRSLDDDDTEKAPGTAVGPLIDPGSDSVGVSATIRF